MADRQGHREVSLPIIIFDGEIHNLVMAFILLLVKKKETTKIRNILEDSN